MFYYPFCTIVGFDGDVNVTGVIIPFNVILLQLLLSRLINERKKMKGNFSKIVLQLAMSILQIPNPSSII